MSNLSELLGGAGGGASSIIKVTRTSNVILASADVGKLIDITSGTFTQTFSASATLGDGWYCYIRNNGTGDITLDPNSSETIDGLTSFIMYPNEVRLIQCDGSTLTSIVLSAFHKVFTSSATFIKPTGYSGFSVYVLGAGGGGGGGGVANGRGGGGGAGGGSIKFDFSQDALSSSESVTIGAGGTSASTTAGTDGGNTTFSTLKGYGGEGGGVGATYNVNVPLATGGGVMSEDDTASGLRYTRLANGSSEWGGAGTGNNNPRNSVGMFGYSSVWGGSAGGAGQLNVFAAGEGGLSRTITDTMRGGGGSATLGGAGGNGPTYGGGGGGSGAIGGNGGYGCGGGGGGNTSSAAYSGGNGGSGLVEIWGIA